MMDAIVRIPPVKYACLISPFLIVACAYAQSPQPDGGFDGTIIDQQGKPVANAEIRLVLEDYDSRQYEGPGPDAFRRITTSDVEGHFTFDKLPDGKYKVQAYLPGMFG
ncbi:MAG: carboxypeptidase regulatory-like domain-containing protein, partial [Candidatus Hydrogenedentes bacterium]|nr:carboxypeptidase regulatory-like domain-containing protein [Candidatus Hydrogenedentota bacterium]